MQKTQEMEHVYEDVESLISPPTSCTSHLSAYSDSNQQNTPSTSSATLKNSKRKRKTKVDEQADEILSMVGERLRNNTTNNDDAFTIFGKHVAVKLRTLPKQTKIYTEKLICDLLFEAEIGNVDKNTKIVTLLSNTNNDIMVDDYSRNYNNPYLQSNEYSRPANYRTPQQYQEYRSLQSTAVTPQPDTSVSTFFAGYQPTEENK